MQTLMALDLSLKCTGWACIGDAGLCYGSQSFIKTPKGQDPAIRYLKFQEWFILMIQAHSPERVVFEEPHLKFRSSIYAAIPLVGIVMTECAKRGIPYSYVNTQRLKKLATGNGRANKADMKHAALEVFPHYDPEADGGIDIDDGGDIADALLLLHITLKGLK
jgi:Holliday junction resolvasome RuvABC endonuclease subunit